MSVSAIAEEKRITFKTKETIYDWEHMKTYVKATAKNLKMYNTLKAIDYAVDAHSGQNRKRSSVPYIYHPLNLACHSLSMNISDDDIIAACLLHDVAYCEDFGEKGSREHGRLSARIARPFLHELGMAEERINDICYGIAIHVDDEADFPGVRTAFALSINDADNIDRFDVYRIHETLVYSGFLEKSFEEKKEYVQKRLSRLRELDTFPMATKTAEEMWKQKLEFYIRFYEKLAAQMENSAELFE